MRRKWVLLVLVIAAVGVGIENWILPSGDGTTTRTPPQQGVRLVDTSRPQARDEQLPPLSRAEVDSLLAGDPGVQRDVFAPLQQRSEDPDPEPGLPRLTGTLVRDGHRVAWFDGRPYSKGESIDGAVVEDIERDHAWLSIAGERVRVDLCSRRISWGRGVQP